MLHWYSKSLTADLALLRITCIVSNYENVTTIKWLAKCKAHWQSSHFVFLYLWWYF
jgi:hypothetical protein